MPYPSQINAEQVVEVALELLEEFGIEQLSLHRLAQTLNVRAPSLYRYFASKTDLLRAVNRVTIDKLIGEMRVASEVVGFTGKTLEAMLHAYRHFALLHPVAYSLLFSNSAPDIRLDPVDAEQFALPLQKQIAELVGEESSLSALRGAWALVHGFIMLEISGQFQRAGDVNAAFEAAIQAYVTGWQ